MPTKTREPLAASASLSTFVVLFAACSTGSADGVADESSGSGGLGTGGASAGGVFGNGGAGTGGEGTGGSSAGGADGTSGSSAGGASTSGVSTPLPIDYIDWRTADEAGMGGSACAPEPEFSIWRRPGPPPRPGYTYPYPYYCFPDVACFHGYVPIRDRFPLSFAYTHVTAVGDRPTSINPTDGFTVPGPPLEQNGLICAGGQDTSPLSIALGDPMIAEDMSEALEHRRTPVSWAELGITQLRFTIETPPATGVAVRLITFSPPCGKAAWVPAMKDGQPLILDTHNQTTTLSLATDFGADLDLTTVGVLNFVVAAVGYAYCIKDLEFLTADGNPVE